MHFSIFLLVFAFCCVYCKNNVKSLTESMGQEVIEIGTPIKDLPPGLDEEPSAEVDDDEKNTLASAPPSTRRETRKTTMISTIAQRMTTDARRDNAVNQYEEERRIEKELSEIYKDTDYKADINKEIQKKPAAVLKDDNTKPISRAKTNFKFQPDVRDRADVERFRTSVDEISCDRATQRLSDLVTEVPSASGRFLTNSIAIGLALVSIFLFK